MFVIARRPTKREPTGRVCGYGGLYNTREEAQKLLDSKKEAGYDWADDMHVVETSGDIGVSETV